MNPTEEPHSSRMNLTGPDGSLIEDFDMVDQEKGKCSNQEIVNFENDENEKELQEPRDAKCRRICMNIQQEPNVEPKEEIELADFSNGSNKEDVSNLDKIDNVEVQDNLAQVEPKEDDEVEPQQNDLALVPVEVARRPLDPTKFDTYPNELLQIVVSFAQLEDLMETIPALSKKWKELHETVCNHKKSFILIVDPEESMMAGGIERQQKYLPEALLKVWSKYDGLKMHTEARDTVVCRNVESFWVGLEEEHLDLAKQKLPNITSLSLIKFTIGVRNKSQQHCLIELLKMWPNLTELKLIGHLFILYENDDNPDDDDFLLLYKQINTLQHLKHLTLFSRTVGDELQISRLLPILPQLESLYLGSFWVDFNYLKSIRQLGIWHMRDTQCFVELDNMHTELAQKVTHLTIFPDADQLDWPPYLNIVSCKFFGLQYLHIRTGIPLAQVFAKLTNLNNLKHLRLWNYHQLGPVSDIDQTELDKLVPLESVELLHLYIRLCTHTQLEWVCRLFPNLKWIKFDKFESKCRECVGPEQKKQCEVQMLKPLKSCTRLCRVYLDRKGIALQNCPLEHYHNEFEELMKVDL